MSKKIIFSFEEEKEILYLYSAKNTSILKIAKKFNVGTSVIRRILKENNILIKNNSFYKSKKVDESFFQKIDSEEKAYVLGFFWADGSLSKNKVFKIKIKDKDLLEKIKAVMKSEHKIGECKETSGFSTGATYYYLSIDNKKLCEPLIKMGINNNKTFESVFPLEFIPPDLIRHFIRGYFDGDGSVYTSCKNKNIGISFTGNFKVLSTIKNFLSQITESKANIHKYKDKNIYDYKIGGRNKVAKIYEYFYENATIFLERKKNVFERFFK